MDDQIIYDLLKEVRDEQKAIHISMNEHASKFSQHLISDQKMADDIDVLKTNVDKYNEILEKLTDTVVIHEARSTTLEKVVIGDDDEPGLVSRVSKLEEPDKVKEYIRKKYIKFAAVVAATGTIIGVVTKVLSLW